jgi:resuscitation-promoting factor RpfC
MHRARHARRSARAPLAWAAAGAAGAAAVAFPLTAQASPPQAALLRADVEPAQPVQADPALRVAAARASIPATPSRVLVKAGDTLYAIAGKVCGTPRDDLALAYNNHVANPDQIQPGELIKIACHAAAKAITARYGAPTRLSQRLSSHAQAPAPAPGPQLDASSARVVTQAATYSGSGSMQQCIISRESGGNSAAVNSSSGAGGLYQFLPSTWHALGHSGLPENASVAEQNAAFAEEVAQSGYSAWGPYDGC